MSEVTLTLGEYEEMKRKAVPPTPQESWGWLWFIVGFGIAIWLAVSISDSKSSATNSSPPLSQPGRAIPAGR